MADGLKVALFGLHRGSSADPDTLVGRARRAEEAGFESFWVGDHVALPSAEAQGADPPGLRRLEALVALVYMAALTSRVRLAVGVIVLPLSRLETSLALASRLGDARCRRQNLPSARPADWDQDAPEDGSARARR